MKRTTKARKGRWHWMFAPLALGCAMHSAAQDAAAASWSLVAPSSERVEFRGLASFDYAGINSGTALFVGAGNPVFAAVTAASFIVNAAVINHSREAQKTSVQMEADKVLLPYQTSIAAYRSQDLYIRAAMQSRAHDTRTATPWQATATPVFSMTQDQKAIVLDSLVEVRAPGSGTPAFASPIRVVGAPASTDDAVTYWTAADGEALRATSESLLAESLRVALLFADTGMPAPTPGARSVRFMQGSTERVERAEVLQEDCGRTLLRTLRGNLMSVPTIRPAEHCPATAPTAVQAASTQ